MIEELKTKTLRELKAILKQFKSGYVAMGVIDILYMHAIEDEIDKRTNR